MAVNQTWTDPSTGGAIDLGTGDTLPETVWDKLLSDFKHMAGSAGFTATPSATHGIEPASGYFMGAAAVNRHIESGNVSATGLADTAVTFANAFASAPNVTTSFSSEYGWCAGVSARTTTGCTIHNWHANATTVCWTAEGAD